MILLTLTLNMTTAQVVETSVTANKNSPIQDYVKTDEQTQPTFEMTPGFKPFTNILLFICFIYFFLGSHTARLNILQESGGYISQTLSNDSPFMDSERNTIHFMFLTEKKNGLFFYMGRDKDHLVVELINGSLRVEADVGGGKIKAGVI